MRPGLIDELRAPEHYRKGGDTLTITNEIDKCGLGRELPLSERARAALDRVVPEVGLIFGSHDYRMPLGRAAVAAGLEPSAPDA